MGDGEPIGDCKLGHWAIDLKKIKKLSKKSGYRVPVWVKSPIRTRIDNPIKLSVRVPKPKKINILVRVPENSVRVSDFWFEFLVSDYFEHPYHLTCSSTQRRPLVMTSRELQLWPVQSKLPKYPQSNYRSTPLSPKSPPTLHFLVKLIIEP